MAKEFVDLRSVQAHQEDDRFLCDTSPRAARNGLAWLISPMHQFQSICSHMHRSLGFFGFNFLLVVDCILDSPDFMNGLPLERAGIDPGQSGGLLS